jgi:hypothetical protein
MMRHVKTGLARNYFKSLVKFVFNLVGDSHVRYCAACTTHHVMVMSHN